MNSLDLRDMAGRWLADARPAVVVQVLSARGSVPRAAGTRMLVAADSVQGSIGGGHLELRAIHDARRLLSQRQPQPVEQNVALGPSLGQCCGGALVLRLALLDDDALQAWPAAAPYFTLQLYGAGHVGRAIARLLAGIPCRVQWIDQRDDEFPAEALPPHIERICVEPVQGEVANAPPGCCYLVLTHSHALDLALCQAILQRGLQRNDIGFFGLIGSKTKRASFEHRLLERGVSATAIDRMVCPIGLPGITGKEPEVIAVAAVAQLLQWAGTERQAR